MIIDMHEHNSALVLEFSGGSVLLDGASISQVWYVDTMAGVVKTYDVFGDGHLHALCAPKLPTGVEYVGGVLSRTLYGKVELFRADGSKYEDLGK